MDVNGKVAVVTGGASGVGLGLAEALLEAGARVAVTDIVPAHLAEARDKLGAGLVTVPHDAASAASWRAMKAEVEDRLGPVDVLCNNAGTCQPFQVVEEIEDAVFERMMAINVTGVFLGCKAFLPEMKARGSGHIVNTASTQGIVANAQLSGYSASKYAVVGLSEGLDEELTGTGVRVSILYPGATHSRLLSDVVGKVPRHLAMEPIWLGRAVVRAIAEGRLHVITHPMVRPNLDQRIERLLGDFGEPAQPGYGVPFKVSKVD